MSTVDRPRLGDDCLARRHALAHVDGDVVGVVLGRKEDVDA